jgi:hypothetical protein
MVGKDVFPLLEALDFFQDGNILDAALLVAAQSVWEDEALGPDEEFLEELKDDGLADERSLDWWTDREATEGRNE